MRDFQRRVSAGDGQPGSRNLRCVSVAPPYGGESTKRDAVTRSRCDRELWGCPTEPQKLSRWPLVKVFDVVAVSLTGIVVIRAIGGIVSALGVPSLNVNLGATSGLGATINQNDLGLPTFVRLEYGTGWADLISGL